MRIRLSPKNHCVFDLLNLPLYRHFWSECTMPKLTVSLLLLSALATLSIFIPATYSFLLGLGFALLLDNPYQAKSAKVSKWLLQACVVGLGFGINAYSVLAVGQSALSLTVLTIVVTIVVGIWLGTKLSVPAHASLLISAGTAICGGSAIAAVAACVHAKPKDISLALAVVFGLNAIALILFPLFYPVLSELFMMTEQQFGLWAAIVIHDTSSVVGAAQQIGDEALSIATTVKLQRALWIIPLVLMLAMTQSGQARITIPWFIGLFLLAMCVNTFFLSSVPMFQSLGEWVVWLAKKGLALTLFLIGASVQWTTLKQVGVKPLVLGMSLWLLISLGSLFMIIAFL